MHIGKSRFTHLLILKKKNRRSLQQRHCYTRYSLIYSKSQHTSAPASMASAPSCALMVTKPPRTLPHSPPPSLSLFISNNPIKIRAPQPRGRPRTASAAKAEFDLAFFERDLEGSDAPPPTIPGASFPDVEDKEEPQCPPGLRKYETMVVLRPDMSEDERLTLTQKYEEV